MTELVGEILALLAGLDEPTAERVARQLLECERPVSARAVAEHLGLRKTDWVYANAERLGGVRLGEGKQPRWRFYLSEVDQRLREFGGSPAKPPPKPAPKPRTPRRGQRREGLTAAGNELLDFEAA